MTTPAIAHAPCPEITPSCLVSLFEALDRHPSRVPVETLHDLLEPELPLPELAQLCRFDEGRYCRNLVRATVSYEMLLVCWRTGQRSPIHDHRGSSCAFQVLSGICTESRFERTPEGALHLSAAARHPAGTVCSSEDADIHQVTNDQPGEDLVTLHIYSPPLRSMMTYPESRVSNPF